MKHILHLFAIVLCAFVLCEALSPCSDRKLSEEQKNLVSALSTPGDFSVKLLKTIEQMKTDSNVIMSPTSIYHLSFLIYTLANKNGINTQKLKKLLNFPHKYDGYNFMAYIKLLEYYDMLNETKLENRIYYDSSIQPNNLLNKVFCREFKDKDFANQLSESIESINDWIRKLTNNLIQEGIKIESFPQPPKVILLNLLYFKGTWMSKFEKDTTRKLPFTDENGRETEVDMMSQKNDYSVWELNDIASKLIEIPYQRNFSMFILLPNENGKGVISNIVSQINDKFLRDMMTRPKNFNDYLLLLPKFSMENEFDVLEVLGKLGIDISSLSLENLSNNRNSLFVDSGTHVAKIQVDEEGTEAAAISAGFSFKMLLSGEFICDRPFIYFICDMSTQSVLFEGIYRKPDNPDSNELNIQNQKLNNDKIYFFEN